MEGVVCGETVNVWCGICKEEERRRKKRKGLKGKGEFKRRYMQAIRRERNKRAAVSCIRLRV